MQSIKNILKANWEIVSVIILFFIVLLILLITGVNGNYIKEGKLYISEVMAKNTYTIKDNNDEYSDYIEIYNGYGNSIDLSGYHLSDNEYETSRWTFPSIEIKPNEYLIVYASGKDKCENNVCHTNFKLSSKGEVITLSDKRGNIINKFTYSSLTNDIAFGYVNRKYTILDSPSPGKENTNSFKYSSITNNDLYINEYMSSNKSINYNSTGKYNDFVELYNNSNVDLEIHNIFLSDDANNLVKYKLPDKVIKKGEYLLIYLSDKSKVVGNEIYANFKLSNDDEYLILSNGKNIIDEIELVELIDNVSYGKYENEWYYFTKATPGSENNTVPLKNINNRKEGNS